MNRRKVSAALTGFRSELDRLTRLDTNNQGRLSVAGGRPPEGSISLRQLQLLSEGVFFSAFRAYENFLEEVFLLYAMQKRTISGKLTRSYLRPRSFDHARDLIQSNMRVLDWASADDIVKRAEMYLEDGKPVKDAIASRIVLLRDMRQIRNHIAHNSKESLASYRQVLGRSLRTVPVKIPTPGEFLLTPSPTLRPKYFLQIYVESLLGLAEEITK